MFEIKKTKSKPYFLWENQNYVIFMKIKNTQNHGPNMSIVIIVPGILKSEILGSAVVQVPSLSALMLAFVASDMFTPPVNGVQIALGMVS